MRIIGGTARGRRFEAPQGSNTRPTLDRVKESLFGMLQFDLPYSTVLDLFSGSGNLGLEAASRGASLVVCNDHAPSCAALIQKNVTELGFSERVRVLCLPYQEAIQRLTREELTFDLAFLDAPYQSGAAEEACRLLFESGRMKKGGRVVIEHDSKRIPKAVLGLTRIVKTKRYGSCALTLMEEDIVL